MILGAPAAAIPQAAPQQPRDPAPAPGPGDEGVQALGSDCESGRRPPRRARRGAACRCRDRGAAASGSSLVRGRALGRGGRGAPPDGAAELLAREVGGRGPPRSRGAACPGPEAHAAPTVTVRVPASQSRSARALPDKGSAWFWNSPPTAAARRSARDMIWRRDMAPAGDMTLTESRNQDDPSPGEHIIIIIIIIYNNNSLIPRLT